MEQAPLLPHSTEEEAEAQRGRVTCSRSQGQQVTDLGFKPAGLASELGFVNTSLLRGRAGSVSRTE